MEWLAGLFLVVMGAIMLVKPDTVWKISESWKTKNSTEPTIIYRNLIRIGGSVILIGGIFATVTILIMK
ncbi:DUF6199 family natural product biosynthesis protein [Bacillus sp. JJ1764]|uniref:DUF6199 family natural product biosynthesis protein n=1 Tax=Bacillus sp. JJ1764 TaxID=3122964 RepID=UPI003000831D